MKRLISVRVLSFMLVGIADARGGMSGGGGRGGFSSGGRSISSAPAPRPAAPSVAAAPRPAPAAAPAPAQRTTTTTTTSTTTTRRTAGGGMVGGPVMYGGFGMGYGYSNGLLTGLIIGNMMHPHNTVVYTGGGQYSNNALLYPDGRVVNQQGYQVGVYQNGQFTAVNGGMVAQAAPADAVQSAPQMVQQPQPVTIVKAGPSAGDIIAMVFLGLIAVILFVILIGIIL